MFDDKIKIIFKMIASEASFSSEINAPMSVYINYISYVRPFGPTGGGGAFGPGGVPNEKWHQRANVTGSLKFKGQVIIENSEHCAILCVAPSLAQCCSIF